MHLLVIGVIALLVFGPKRLPELGKGLGDSIKGFKKAIGGPEETLAPSVHPVKAAAEDDAVRVNGA